MPEPMRPQSRAGRSDSGRAAKDSTHGELAAARVTDTASSCRDHRLDGGDRGRRFADTSKAGAEQPLDETGARDGATEAALTPARSGEASEWGRLTMGR